MSPWLYPEDVIVETVDKLVVFGEEHIDYERFCQNKYGGIIFRKSQSSLNGCVRYRGDGVYPASCSADANVPKQAVTGSEKS